MRVLIEEAQAYLPDLLKLLAPGEEILITRGDEVVAKLVGVASKPKAPRQLGALKGTVLYMAPDFDAPLDDFKEYME